MLGLQGVGAQLCLVRDGDQLARQPGMPMGNGNLHQMIPGLDYETNGGAQRVWVMSNHLPNVLGLRRVL